MLGLHPKGAWRTLTVIMLDSLYCRMGNVESCTWVERVLDAMLSNGVTWHLWIPKLRQKFFVSLSKIIKQNIVHKKESREIASTCEERYFSSKITSKEPSPFTLLSTLNIRTLSFPYVRYFERCSLRENWLHNDLWVPLSLQDVTCLSKPATP